MSKKMLVIGFKRICDERRYGCFLVSPQESQMRFFTGCLVKSNPNTVYFTNPVARLTRYISAERASDVDPLVIRNVISIEEQGGFVDGSDLFYINTRTCRFSVLAK